MQIYNNVFASAMYIECIQSKISWIYKREVEIQIEIHENY